MNKGSIWKYKKTNNIGNFWHVFGETVVFTVIFVLFIWF